MDKCKIEVTTPNDNENKATGWKRQDPRTLNKIETKLDYLQMLNAKFSIYDLVRSIDICGNKL